MSIKKAVLAMVLALGLTGTPALSDVLFIHDITSQGYMLGKTDARMTVGYTDHVKYTNKETRYKAGFLKRFFGKVKTGRSTSRFDLKADTVSEVDWENEYIYVYPLSRISDPDWHRKKIPHAKEREEFAKARYTVMPPQISFDFKAGHETVNGYESQRVDILLTLLTIDKKKNAESRTTINQSLWLTHSVDGFDEFTRFNTDLSLKTGVSSHRLGLLSDLLSHYPGDLTAIEADLSRITGYAVKSHIHITGAYVQNFEGKPPKTSTMVLKDETAVLKEVRVSARLDTGTFVPPASFAQKLVK